MSAELNELRISSGRHESEAKDATITLDTYKDRVVELQKDIDDQKFHIAELRTAQTREKEEEKEKRKQEMLSEMMSKIDMVSPVMEIYCQAYDCSQGDTGLDPASERLRHVLTQLDGAPNGDTVELIRVHLAENQNIIRDMQDKLRATHEEGDMQAKRRTEVEKMLSRRDAAYEELLGTHQSSPKWALKLDDR